MLNNESYASNPLVNTSEDNSFAVKSLLQVPIGILHRKYRERIMKAWSPAEDDTTSTQLDPMVLALKIKTMRFPMFYKVSNHRSMWTEKATNNLGNGFPTTLPYGERFGHDEHSKSTCQPWLVQGVGQINIRVSLPYSFLRKY